MSRPRGVKRLIGIGVGADYFRPNLQVRTPTTLDRMTLPSGESAMEFMSVGLDRV